MREMVEDSPGYGSDVRLYYLCFASWEPLRDTVLKIDFLSTADLATLELYEWDAAFDCIDDVTLSSGPSPNQHPSILRPSIQIG